MKPSVRAFVAIACLGSVLSFPSRAERLAVPGEPAGAGWMLLGALVVGAVIARRRCQWASLRGSPAISPASDVPHESRQQGPQASLPESSHEAPRETRQPALPATAIMAGSAGKTGTARLVGTATAAAAARPVLRLVRSD